tara:strand:+ start:1041 stop:1244 length:204 start_codon:yes stop_codon:yes gene_type:complete
MKIAIMASLPAKRNVYVYARQYEFYYFANIINPSEPFENLHIGILSFFSCWGTDLPRAKQPLGEGVK